MWGILLVQNGILFLFLFLNLSFRMLCVPSVAVFQTEHPKCLSLVLYIHGRGASMFVLKTAQLIKTKVTLLLLNKPTLITFLLSVINEHVQIVIFLSHKEVIDPKFYWKYMGISSVKHFMGFLGHLHPHGICGWIVLSSWKHGCHIVNMWDSQVKRTTIYLDISENSLIGFWIFNLFCAFSMHFRSLWSHISSRQQLSHLLYVGTSFLMSWFTYCKRGSGSLFDRFYFIVKCNINRMFFI